jgi:hypothetical protein
LIRAMMFMGRLSYRVVGQTYQGAKQGKREARCSTYRMLASLREAQAVCPGCHERRS